jgi:hypothetical protein
LFFNSTFVSIFGQALRADKFQFPTTAASPTRWQQAMKNFLFAPVDSFLPVNGKLGLEINEFF